jgi:dephospho-CoA kinase
MLKVGLTGSIAVGKSFVCEVFAELGCFVLDADVSARDVVQPKTKGLIQIVENFGEEVLQPNGELDRVKLGSIIFSDDAKRQLLNEIVHPLVIDAQNTWLTEKEAENPDGIAIVDAALMIESGGFEHFEKLIVVWCDSDIQLQRLMLRNNLNKAEALKRISSQMPQNEKKTYADFLIDTSEGFEATRNRTKEVFGKLKEFLPQRHGDTEKND